MNELLKYSQIKVSRTSLDITRTLLDDIKWGDRLIGISGYRGVGKTTLMLQRLKQEYGNSLLGLYITLDNFYFTKNRLFDFAEEFYLNGGKTLYLDEVHRYPNWSVEVKNLYDLYDDLKIVFSSSSALQLHRADGDLSRRAAMYNMQELSFREYLKLSGIADIKIYSLPEILENHIDIAQEISNDITIMPLFKKYLREGVYPFFTETQGQFYDRLVSSVNIVIENDLQIIENISYHTAYKLRQLVALLADSVPFKVNISELSRKIGLSRDLLLRLLGALDRANLIKGIQMQGSVVGYLTKPDKIYLNNTALLYALNSGKDNIEGTIRETFFMNQMLHSHKVQSSKTADFCIDGEYTFEVGGSSKSFRQIAGEDKAYVISDNLLSGYGNKIPLWLFGFMY